MLAEYKTNTNIGVGLGIVLQIAGRFMLADNLPLGFGLTLVGAVFFIWGCCSYAKGKGYHWALGFLGLLSCIGLLILVVLQDKHR